MASANHRAERNLLHPSIRNSLSAIALCGLLLLAGRQTGNAFAQGNNRRCNDRSRVKIEEELRYRLRTLRQSIDSYKTACEQGLVGPLDRKVNDECYPPSLEVLVNGIQPPNRKTRIRFLRHIPVDPTTGKREWGVRSMQDDPQSTVWGGENVFDVYSKNPKRGLDKTAYKDW